MNHVSRSGFFEILTNNIQVNNGVEGESSNTTPLAKSGLAPYTGPWGTEQVLHLIRRTMFGVTHQDSQFFSKLTLAQSLDVLLTSEPKPAPPVNAYNDKDYTDPDVPFGQTWVSCPFTDGKGVADHKRLRSLYGWWVGLMLNQGRSITQKMTLFWSNHLGCELQYTFDSRPSYSYLELIMKQSVGNFKKLMLEMTTNPGMLQYLSGNESTVEAPNENYSREMQELFTVGKGPNSHYTQDDINAAARILTGWTTTPNGMKTIYNAAMHDSSDKHFSAFYNNTVIKGRAGKESAEETMELIDMIFANRETAMHICRCLYRWFVYSDIDNVVEANVIGPLADILIKNNFEILPVLRALLGSEHFFDALNIGHYIKNPVDYLIGLCRQFNVTSFPNDLTKQYNAWSALVVSLRGQGMGPGEPPNVAGWPAYYLGPAYYQLWINSDSLAQRNSAIDQLLDEHGMQNYGQDNALKLDVLAFARQCADPSDISLLTDESSILLSPVAPEAAEIWFAKNFLSWPGPAGGPNWPEAWAAYIAAPNDETKKSLVIGRLKQYYSYLLKNSQSHLM